MNVNIKKFDVRMEIKNKGVELEVRDPSNNHLGDLIVTKTKLEWCEGKKRRGNGKTITWEQFRQMMNKR